MVIGVCHITLMLHDNHSLKGKRQVLRKVISNVQNKFNVSIAEVGSQDKWQKAEVGITTAGGDKLVINSVLDKVIDFIENLHIAEVTAQSIELINYKV